MTVHNALMQHLAKHPAISEGKVAFTVNDIYPRLESYLESKESRFRRTVHQLKGTPEVLEWQKQQTLLRHFLDALVALQYVTLEDEKSGHYKSRHMYRLGSDTYELLKRSLRAQDQI